MQIITDKRDINSTPILDVRKQTAKGSSLVELLVAIGVISLAAIMVVAIVNKGRELQVSDKHRREARTIIDSVMVTRYDNRDYLTITSSADSTRTDSIVIDKMFRGVVSQRVRNATTVINGLPSVPMKRVTVSVRWAEAGNMIDSVWLEKLMPLLRERI